MNDGFTEEDPLEGCNEKYPIFQEEIKELEIELEKQITVLLNIQKEPPFLRNFDIFIRKRAMADIEQILQKKYSQMGITIQKEDGDFSDVDTVVEKKELIKQTIKIVDKKLLDLYIEKLQKRADNVVLFSNNDRFEQLNMPTKLKNLLPLTKEKRAIIYSLCVKWLLVVEKNTDLIARCSTYNIISSRNFSDYYNQIKSVNCPNKPFLLGQRGRLIEYCLNFVVDNICSKALNGFLNKVKKFILTYFIYYFFGLGLMSSFSFLSSVVEIPFINDRKQTVFSQKMLDYALNMMLKLTSVKNEDLCAYLLRQSISAVDEVNTKIEEVLDTLVNTDWSSEEYDLYLKVLIEELEKLTEKRESDFINRKDEYFEMAIKELDDGWIMIEDVETIKTGVVEVENMEFFLLEKNRVEEEIIPSKEESNFEVVKIGCSDEEDLDEILLV